MSRRLLPLLVASSLLGIYNGLPASAQETPKPVTAALSDARGVQEAFIRVTQAVKPSVVTIYCETFPSTDPKDKTNLPFGRDEEGNPTTNDDPTEPRTSLGTGMVVRADGYILTNYHVVKGVDLIRVLFNSDSEQVDKPLAKVMAYDEESDLAVLKIPRTGLAPVEWADSDAVRIGQWSLAIGAPFDQPQTLTAGIISARGRHLEKKGTGGLQDYLQTDAAINPGNSGGPLIDLEGRVIGVNTAILSPSRFNVGIGFSVPSNTVKSLLARLIEGQSIKRGFLGVQYVRLDEAVAKEWGIPGGLQIGAIAEKDGKPTGPAQEAGLREDDIIIGINGEPVSTTDRFRALVAGQVPGTEMTLSVARPEPKGTELQRFEVKVKLGDRANQYGPTDAPKVVDTNATKTPPTSPGWGIEVDNTPDISVGDRLRFQLNGKEPGAVVTKIVPGSPADDANIPRGLRIVRVRWNGAWTPIVTAKDWRDFSKTVTPDSHLLVQLRDGDGVSVYKLLVVPAATEVAPVAPVAAGA